ncbi:MAG: histidine kinase [Parvularculaceae bacterium]|nr:histidine kinase [Parvularculaceae bacterium]
MKTRSATVFFVTLAIWIVHVAVFTLSNALENNPQTRELAAARIVVSFVGVGFCYAILFVLHRLPTRRLPYRVIALALMSPISGELFAWIAYFAMKFATGSEASLEFRWSSALLVLSMYSWLFFAWGALILSIEYSFDLREQEKRNAEFRALAQDAKLRALQAQINPHFMFNSLNSLSALILEKRNDDAETMLSRLAKFLRFTLSANALKDITLEEEFGHQKDYLAIEQVRDPGLRVRFDAHEDILPAKIPALLLQPLVENAIKHGAAGGASVEDIVISASRNSDRLVIELTNRVGGDAARRIDCGGLGIANVRDRLANRFGDDQSIEAGLSDDGHYRVRLEMPYRT